MTNSMPIRLFLLALTFLALLPPAKAEDNRSFSVITMESQAVMRSLPVWIDGYTEASKRIQVRAETSGQIIERPIEKGMLVEEGQTLCRLDAGVRDSVIAKAEAALTQAEFELTSSQSLYKSGNLAETALKRVQAGVDAARADLAQARLDKERVVIKAPSRGIIETPLPEIGDQLAVGQLCATVATFNPILVTGRISERYIGDLKPGASVTAELVDGSIQTGTVTYISASANSNHTFRIESELANPDGHIRDGMSARFSVALTERETHTIPGAALSLNEEGVIGIKTWNPDSRMVSFAPVVIIGETMEGFLVEGLAPKVLVILVGHDYLLPGQTVNARPLTAEDNLR